MTAPLAIAIAAAVLIVAIIIDLIRNGFDDPPPTATYADQRSHAITLPGNIEACDLIKIVVDFTATPPPEHRRPPEHRIDELIAATHARITAAEAANFALGRRLSEHNRRLDQLVDATGPIPIIELQEAS